MKNKYMDHCLPKTFIIHKSLRIFFIEHQDVSCIKMS